ncbi:MAG: methyltransferase domain-containing protein [Candidatus Magnetomorum sp.]|nr:methyltransferase domain-containing protein [Candidatus Magnetomorum sp.]
MKKYFDPKNNRLMYYGHLATPEYWDNHWKTDDFSKAIKNKKNMFIVKTTKAYLPDNARIIDGGCGIGDKVYALYRNGFDAYGIDFANQTVKMINACIPEINVLLGDVRQLDFPDHYFDGYWSLGVIEHFYDGFDDIVREMYRVLRPGGFLFLTVPEMSKLRQYLAKKGKYPDCSDLTLDREFFYQFAYTPEYIIKTITKNDFIFITHTSLEGVKGFKDESKIFKPILQWLYDHPSLPVKAVKRTLDIIMSPFTGHSGLYIFYKSEDRQ